MSLAKRAASRIRRRARQAASLRRQNSLLSATVLAANLTSGATSTSLRAASGRLTGRVVAGSRFSVAGVSGTYEVSDDARTPATGVVAIQFSPAIPTGQVALTGAAVTFSQPYADHEYKVINRSASSEDKKAIDEGLTTKLLPFESGKPAPEQNDLLDGVAIKRVGTVDADDGIAYYRCYVLDGTVRP